MEKYDVSDKMFNEIEKHRIHCKNCGCSIVIYPFENKNKKICRWCGHTVYINDNEEFKDKLKQKMGKLVSKEKKNGN